MKLLKRLFNINLVYRQLCKSSRIIYIRLCYLALVVGGNFWRLGRIVLRQEETKKYQELELADFNLVEIKTTNECKPVYEFSDVTHPAYKRLKFLHKLRGEVLSHLDILSVIRLHPVYSNEYGCKYCPNPSDEDIYSESSPVYP